PLPMFGRERRARRRAARAARRAPRPERGAARGVTRRRSRGGDHELRRRHCGPEVSAAFVLRMPEALDSGSGSAGLPLRAPFVPCPGPQSSELTHHHTPIVHATYAVTLPASPTPLGQPAGGCRRSAIRRAAHLARTMLASRRLRARPRLALRPPSSPGLP